jgi:23S rRNA pseudouridine1911/1915/1917 synthase
MPSKNMLPKGKRRQSVKQEYRAQRTLAQEREAAQAAQGGGDEAEEQRSWSTAETGQPVAGTAAAKSPWARRAGLVTSGPESGKLPPEQDTQSLPRYGSRYAVEAARPEIPVLEDLEPEDGMRSLSADPAAAGLRLDAYLAKALPEVSRARVVLLIENAQVTVDGRPGRAKQKLKGGELIEIEGDPQPAPLNATPEAIPLTLVYEDEDLAVVDKPAGMMVHAGSGAPEHNRGTLVNALLYHFGGQLSQTGGGVATPGGVARPGIVHRLDKQTSGLLVVAKNDLTHRKLAEMFAARGLRKVYLALVHGELKPQAGTIELPIGRDLVRRTRMTTRRAAGGDVRSAVSHFRVLERIGSAGKPGPFGPFTLVEVRIETGRTHQIRVHLQALGHPVVGDFLYGAPRQIAPARAAVHPGRAAQKASAPAGAETLTLQRNFLHAAELSFPHPRTGATVSLASPLPAELSEFLDRVRG